MYTAPSKKRTMILSVRRFFSNETFRHRLNTNVYIPHAGSHFDGHINCPYLSIVSCTVLSSTIFPAPQIFTAPNHPHTGVESGAEEGLESQRRVPASSLSVLVPVRAHKRTEFRAETRHGHPFNNNHYFLTDSVDFSDLF